MAIIAKNNGGDYAPMESGVYVGRCVQMLQIGTVTEIINGESKTAHKVILGFEFPTEKKVFKEENGEQPFFLRKEYTLSFHEKSTLRKHLETWRGKEFSDTEARSFDITKLLNVPCTINVVHKQSKTGKVYAEIGSISPLMKGTICPEQINPSQVLSFDSFDNALFESLPEYLRKKIESSEEYEEMNNKLKVIINDDLPLNDDLPF